MSHTIFDTPVITPLIRALSALSLKVCGWRLEGQLPGFDKFVAIAAPHTSNWDFPVLMAVAFAFRVKAFWIGKHTLFRRPFGFIFRYMGGIPIDRSSPQGLVSQSIELYRNSDKMILAIPPEGTRSKVDHWKSGFYHIAVGAQAPIATGFIDYKRKATGFGPVIHPTGDIEADMKLIRNFYSNVTGKYPDQMGEIMIAPRSRKMRM